MMTFLLIVWWMSYQAYALHSGVQSSNSKQEYENDLVEIQEQMERKLLEIQKQMKIMDQIVQSTMSEEEKVIEISEGIADERNSLFQIQKLLSFPLRRSTYNCTTLSRENKMILSEKLVQVQTQLQKMKGAIKTCKQKDCDLTKELLFQIQQQSAYLNMINKTVNSRCCEKDQFVEEKAIGTVDIGRGLLKDNLNAENWFYGELSEMDYKLRVFELGTKYNLTSCPLQTPFVGQRGDVCVKCGEGELFSLSQRKCLGCQHDSFLNLSTSSCVKCPHHQFYDGQEKTCKPCPKNTIMNQQTKNCQFCQKNQYPSPTTQKCEDCPEGQFYNLEESACTECNIKGGQYPNYQSMQCQNCPIGEYYGREEGKCKQCDDGNHYNLTLGICSKCEHGKYNQKEGVCEQCGENQQYDETNQLCIACQRGTLYDQDTQKCSYQKLVSELSKNCPEEKPYYSVSEGKCEECPEGFSVSPSTGKCSEDILVSICPPSKPHYNPQTLGCE